ncbi:Uncharacterized protein conserved in bacteria [Corynebacterium kutscheri]|uniref:Uncharacterized protein conserved in bacteria n=1 Tax=Corynebacterium kutscheri TaxID=35755 RepID=A0AB38VQM4_9CORY|nr:four-carbon acid sugar kinase family protein [Corynebacterium kutscheri]VEH05736.1 Uncharacterized protein conserved in bacteria [Corynebacterium kutscheri]VEH81631.1 Uncharacterized protein conserved in bacteria [Corynebacterium kutscheri]
MSYRSGTELLAPFLGDVPTTAAAVRETIAIAESKGHHDPILVVLDDDPTGTQSVADLPVLTRWREEDLAWALEQKTPAIYVMTNSRSLSPADAQAINNEVATAAYAAAQKYGVELSFVSRSDSTLRGHFPLEPDTLADAARLHDVDIDGYLLVPAFGDAGRITVAGVHYAGNDTDGYLPVGQSEFAQDATFGYHNSELAKWVEEKTEGRVTADEVLVIDLNTIRSGADTIAEKLLSATHRQPIVSDIVTEDDLRLLSLGVIQAEAQGKRFIYRVGPPFVRARIGQDVPKPLNKEDLHTPDNAVAGGLIVVGSHVPTTTRQLNHLLENTKPYVVELDVAEVLGNRREEYLTGLVTLIANQLSNGNVVFHTSRQLVKGKDGEESLAIARKVSAALVAVVNQVIHQVTPRFVIAKGGITSSDVASKGLEMTRAMVVGPMQEGIISLWASADGPATGVAYIVFAGNVGTDTSLAEVVEKLS